MKQAAAFSIHKKGMEMLATPGYTATTDHTREFVLLPDVQPDTPARALQRRA
jgi:hypothetical protein